MVGYLLSGYLDFHQESKTFLESKHVRFRETLVYKNFHSIKEIQTLETEAEVVTAPKEIHRK